jgi:hypothetical protein
VDTGADPVPRLGEAAVLSPATGRLAMSPTGIARQVPLKDRLVLPVGSLVNASRGTVHLTGAGGRGGGTQEGDFRGGAFRFRQTGGSRPLTELRLAGANFSNCGKGRASASARRPRRRLFADGRGRFRTRGRNSTATVRGTAWLTQDTCAGTLTRVSQGSVRVRDFRLRKTRVVKSGQRYLARARR